MSQFVQNGLKNVPPPKKTTTTTKKNTPQNQLTLFFPVEAVECCTPAVNLIFFHKGSGCFDAAQNVRPDNFLSY